MNLSTDRSHGVPIVRVKEARLAYPLLPNFAHAIVALIEGGDSTVILNL